MAKKVDYYGKVSEVIAKFFLIDQSTLTRETGMVTDLGAKSVITMQIMSELEDDMDVTLNFMQFKRLKTVGEIADYLQDACEN